MSVQVRMRGIDNTKILRSSKFKQNMNNFNEMRDFVFFFSSSIYSFDRSDLCVIRSPVTDIVQQSLLGDCTHALTHTRTHMKVRRSCFNCCSSISIPCR